jgi:hypothetical protein
MAEMLTKILEKSSEVDRMRNELEKILRIVQSFLEPKGGSNLAAGTRSIQLNTKELVWVFTFYVFGPGSGNKAPSFRVQAGTYAFNPAAFESAGGPDAVRSAYRDADAMIKAMRRKSKSFDAWVKNLLQE